MPAFDDDEIIVGAQPYLTEEVLRRSGRCSTTASMTNGEDRSAQKNRNYQIVSVNASEQKCFAAPVVTAKSPSDKHIALCSNLKHNFPAKAKAALHYLHEEQIVEIPFDVLKQASAGDKSTKHNRRSYAPGQTGELDKIRDRFMAEDKLIGNLRPLTEGSISDCDTTGSSD